MKTTAFALLAAFLIIFPFSNSRAANDDALLEQIIAIASQNQDSETTAQIRAYVEQNRTTIENILNNYQSYLQQAMNVANGGDVSPSSQTSSTTPSSSAAPVQTQQSNGLQTSSLQTSSPLQTSHLETTSLSGYPSLPSGAPTSSITNPTPEQLAQGILVDRKISERKHFFMRLAGVEKESR